MTLDKLLSKYERTKARLYRMQESCALVESRGDVPSAYHSMLCNSIESDNARLDRLRLEINEALKGEAQ